MAKKQPKSGSNVAARERAAEELARQIGIIIQKDKKKLGVFPAEFLTKAAWAKISKKKGVKLSLLLTKARANSLGFKASGAMRLPISTLNFDAVMALADPTHGALSARSGLGKHAEKANIFEPLLTLAKSASLLPALLLIEGALPKEWLVFSAKTILKPESRQTPEVLQTASAKLPIKDAPHTRIVSFRVGGTASVHLALIVGDVASNKEATLTRVHSSCVTGDILGSLRCDCGDQLQQAMQKIIGAKSGVLIYLHQEGRGIGITNKLRAYKLQEMGVDTYEANLLLGFDEDERDFSIAAEILKKLGVNKIRLLTNNPHKIILLKKYGINVEKRVPLIVSGNDHNRAYIDAKGKKAGHLL